MSTNENIFSREVHVTVKDVNEYIPEWGQVLLITFITRPPSSPSSPSSPPSLSSPPPSPSSPGGVRRPSWGGGDVRGHRHRLCHRQVVDMIVVIMNVVIMIVVITNVVMLSLPSYKWYFWSPPYTQITKQFGSTSSTNLLQGLFSNFWRRLLLQHIQPRSAICSWSGVHSLSFFAANYHHKHRHRHHYYQSYWYLQHYQHCQHIIVERISKQPGSCHWSRLRQISS